MPKAVAEGKVDVEGVATPFIANAAPDPFDARDLVYRPRLQPLAPRLDRRPKSQRHVMEQIGSSCTGHAVATMINTVLAAVARKPPYERVSPYMLYYLARRYDEFAGEEDLGSSLRGVLKGWWRHGVALQEEWKDEKTFIDLENKDLVESCRTRPLGAFYRVDTQRIDDLQSAITELNAIVVSAMIHDGWTKPAVEKHATEAKPMHVIRRKPGSKPLGGHAFALVGYNSVGFLVQNSWGETWGNDGFATLPYEEWIETAYDAWVARPGVPLTPVAHIPKSVSGDGMAGALPAPDVVRAHVLNVGNEGRLSTNGNATSSRTQLEALVASMDSKHVEWKNRNVVIYIHGGLNSEGAGLSRVKAQVQWWLNNRVYPIFIAWQSGPLETLINQIADLVKAPFGAVPSFFEGIDRAVEKVCANVIPFGWSQMKDNAMKASGDLSGALDAVDWFKEPGATLLAHLLAASHMKSPLRLHIVAHSAGGVYVNGLVPRLEKLGIDVQSLTYLASASRADDFQTHVAQHIGKAVKRVTSFVLNDDFELDDTVGPVYHKSLLYLVSRGFERPKSREVAIVGMQKFGVLTPNMIVSTKSRPGGKTDDSYSTSQTHGGFDDDQATMTAVLLRILGLRNVTDPAQRYTSNAQPVAAPPLAAARGVRAAKSPVIGGADDALVMPVKRQERRRSKRIAKKAPQPSPARRRSR